MESDETVLAEIVKEIEARESDTLTRADRAIRLVQDEYRYLTVNIELGAQAPTPPAIVVRRRYGDGKDLSYLLVQLLKRLGIAARPILINSRLRKSVAAMLPMDGLFDHVVVEYEVQGQTRWVDATMKQQGGGALNRSIPDYGAGLPVDASATRLVESPHATAQASRYELKETILLDTTGAPSFLSAVLHTKGSHAEDLRQQLEKSGIEGVAAERLQFCASRFVNAKRVGDLEFRDDRSENELVLAEVFEINGFLSPVQARGAYRFRLANNLMTKTLLMPEKGPRRAPFSLPYPCNIVHTVVVESPALRPMGSKRQGVATPFIRFNRSYKCLHRFWSITFALSTLADAVPAEGIDEHRTAVEKVWNNSLWEIMLPPGYTRPVKRKDFGALPPPSRRPASYAAEMQPIPTTALPVNVQLAGSKAMPGLNRMSRQPAKPRRSRHSLRKEREKKMWLAAAVIFWILVILGVITWTNRR